MDLIRLAETSFVLLDDETVVDLAKQLLGSTAASHLIIHRRHFGENLYYLFLLGEVLNGLKQCKDSATLAEALELHDSEATPAIEGSTNADRAPDRCVIVNDGQLVGFLDINQPPFELARGLSEVSPGTSEIAVEQENSFEGFLQAEFPDNVLLNETASLLVYLTTSPSSIVGLSITAVEGTVLDIVIQPRRGFQIEGRTNRQIKVTGEPESLPIMFMLKAKELGQGDIRVLVFQNGITIGYLKLTPIVLQEASGVLRTNPTSHQQLVATTNAAAPDLSLHIEDAIVNGKKGFRVLVTSGDPDLGLNLKEFGPLTFEVEPGQYFEEFYKDIENYSLVTPEAREIALRELEGKGAYLFSKLFPPEAQETLWAIRDRVSTVFIQSSEPWIPWELCRLHGVENGRDVEGPFFCEAYAVTRWIPGIGVKPRLKLQNMAVVVPSDSGLAFASDELNYVMSLAGEKRKVTRVPARYLALYNAFQLGEYDVWHFSGHGAARGPDPDRAIIVLENNEQFFPQRIVGTLMNVGRSRPLIFFNACQIGKSGLSLTDIGGWARQFLLAGAGAFIGAYWSVYDQPAFQFSQELYKHLLAGVPIGEAGRQARLAVRTSEDPTWLAYTIFAHPLASALP